jgi:hypothetical protein
MDMTTQGIPTAQPFTPAKVAATSKVSAAELHLEGRALGELFPEVVLLDDFQYAPAQGLPRVHF